MGPGLWSRCRTPSSLSPSDPRTRSIKGVSYENCRTFLCVWINVGNKINMKKIPFLCACIDLGIRTIKKNICLAIYTKSRMLKLIMNVVLSIITSFKLSYKSTIMYSFVSPSNTGTHSQENCCPFGTNKNPQIKSSFCQEG
jgi:hypothetical protein